MKKNHLLLWAEAFYGGCHHAGATLPPALKPCGEQVSRISNMDRQSFDKGLRDYDTLKTECHIKAAEVIAKLGGEVDFKIGRYTFIDANCDGEFIRARVRNNEVFFDIDLDDSMGIIEKDFVECTWDEIMLADVMDKIFELEENNNNQ